MNRYEYFKWFIYNREDSCAGQASPVACGSGLSIEIIAPHCEELCQAHSFIVSPLLSFCLLLLKGEERLLKRSLINRFVYLKNVVNLFGKILSLANSRATDTNETPVCNTTCQIMPTSLLTMVSTMKDNYLYQI